MNKTLKKPIVVACAAIVVLSGAVYLLFHGYFDPGNYVILSAQWSQSRQVAMVAKRTYQEASGNPQIFVLVGDHIFSPTELKHALHGPSVIFSSGRECLTLQWQDPHDLLISCNGESITAGEINLKHEYSGDIKVSYTNIAEAKK